MSSMRRFTLGLMLLVPILLLPAGCGSNPPADVHKYFMYVANSWSNDISGYSMDPVTGRLTALGSWAAGTFPDALAIEPSSTFIYAANYTTCNLSAFRINPADGILQPLTAGFPVELQTNHYPFDIKADPLGRFIYAVNGQSAKVYVFHLDQTTGALTGADGSPFTLGNQPVALMPHPGGNYLYMACWGENKVRGYQVNASTGALTELTVCAAGANPRCMALSPAEGFLYVGNDNSSDISAYAIAATGLLTPVPGSPFGLPAGGKAAAITIDPAGRFAYVADINLNKIRVYGIGADGALTSIAGADYALSAPSALAIGLSGKFLYAVSGGKIHGFQTSGTGALSPVDGSPFAAGNGPNSFAFVKF